MTGSSIEHIGILVPDLEAAIERWSRALGYTFSPIARYRTHRYVDRSDPRPHFHDARISFSREAGPRIELMELTGTGTHGPSELGVHHLAFMDTPDPVARMRELAELGIGEDGRVTDEAGRVLLCFTQPSALDGVRLEFVSPLPAPTVADDGSALWRDPTTGRNSLWGPPEVVPEAGARPVDDGPTLQGPDR